jgi:hypothetical protein
VLLALVGDGVFFDAQYDHDGDFAYKPPTKEEPQIVPNDSSEFIKVAPYTIEVLWDQSLNKETPTGCGEDGGGREGCFDAYVVYYRAGRIQNGVFAGLPLYLRVEDGLGVWFQHSVIFQDKEVILEQDNFVIKGATDLPEIISIPGSQYTLKKFGVSAIVSADTAFSKEVFDIPGIGRVYLGKDGCMFIVLPDHTILTYDFIFPFVAIESGQIEMTFIDGTKNKEEYEGIRILGCGASCLHLAEVDETKLDPATRLLPVGATSNGEPIYSYRNPSDPTFRDLYNNKNTLPYISTSTEFGFQAGVKNKYTYDQFIAFRPLLYWKDPLGRWIEFKNKRFLIAAEKCKPVIYLFPLKETKMTVRVTPNGGFLKTIPDYGNDGWHVTAFPDGTIVESATGQTYPYLYWSGVGLNYPVHEDEGWVVKKDEIDTFLNDMLPKLGLQGREITDFKEYWVAKLSESPYYQISFLSKNEFDKLAPLQVSPARPNTVIRVFMTAKALPSPIDLKATEIASFSTRVGFTLVEWGGTLLR